jgi:hypothetical protein
VTNGVNEEIKRETDPVWIDGTNGKGEEVGKGHRRVNMVQILCEHIRKWKNEIC